MNVRESRREPASIMSPRFVVLCGVLDLLSRTKLQENSSANSMSVNPKPLNAIIEEILDDKATHEWTKKWSVVTKEQFSHVPMLSIFGKIDKVLIND